MFEVFDPVEDDVMVGEERWKTNESGGDGRGSYGRSRDLEPLFILEGTKLAPEREWWWHPLPTKWHVLPRGHKGGY